MSKKVAWLVVSAVLLGGGAVVFASVQWQSHMQEKRAAEAAEHDRLMKEANAALKGVQR